MDTFNATPTPVVSTLTGRSGGSSTSASGSFRLEHIEPSTLPEDNPADEIAGYVVYVGRAGPPVPMLRGATATACLQNRYIWYRPDVTSPGFLHLWTFVKVKPNTTTYLHNWDAPNY